MQKEKKGKILILVLLFISIIAIGITIWVLFFRQSKETSLDYAPKQVDVYAEPIEGEDDGEKMEQPVGGGAVSLTYSKDIVLDLNTKEAELIFQNPQKSNQDMMLQLVIDDKVIAQSERLPAGYKLTKLTEVDTDQLTAGAYEGKFVVLYYHTETSEKALVNTEIPVTIEVQ